MTSRSALIAVSITGVALAATGCSSSSSPSSDSSSAAPTEAPTTAPTATPTAAPTDMPTKKPTDGGGSSKSAIPAAPAGAKLLGESSRAGNEYARYKIEMSPKKVVNKYKRQAQNQGYTIKSSGGSGGGWGGYGGSNYGMKAEKSGSYRDVQAGGESGAPTYYEVCVGADSAALSHCEGSSNRDSRDSDSRGS